MMDLLKNTIGRLRIIGFLEGVSFLVLLFIAMPLKYMANLPLAVKITGMAHGLLFVLYILYVVMAKIEYNWSAKKSVLAFVASLVPFGTFWADAKLFR